MKHVQNQHQVDHTENLLSLNQDHRLYRLKLSDLRTQKLFANNEV